MFDEYLTHLRAVGKSESTITTYRRQLNQFALWMSGNGHSSDPRDITSLDAADYRRYLQEKGKAPGTVNTALAALDAFCEWMRVDGHILHNPIEKVKRVEQVDEAPKWLTRSEKGRLLREIELRSSIRDKTIIHTLLFAGLRAAELCDLKHEDIVITERKGHIIVRQGKGNKRRTVPIERDLRECLVTYMDEYPVGEWLFPSQRSSKLSYIGLYQLCQKYGDKSKIDNLSPHVLRHTFGHDLASKGVRLDIIARLMGHKKLDNTAIYIKPGEEELQAAIDKLSYT